MKLFAVLLLAWYAVAAVSGGGKSCPSGLYSVPQCCSTDVLGVAALDCKSPSSRTGSSFTCASGVASCCVLPVAGQAILCTEALG